MLAAVDIIQPNQSGVVKYEFFEIFASHKV